jgi:hypothetical protein
MSAISDPTTLLIDGRIDVMKTNLKRLVTAVGFAIGGFLLNATTAHASAITGLGGTIFATGSTVTIDILASDSLFANSLSFFYNWTDADRNVADKITFGIDNQLTTIDLGAMSVGQELIFGIKSPQGNFLIGDGTRNSDGLAHAWITAAPAAAGFTESWIVGFEDLWKGGDRDFNDAVFRVNQTAFVPEPTSLALLAIGIIGLGVQRRVSAR